MKNFAYARADTARSAIGLMSRTTNAKFLGGGTNLIDLMREEIEQPDALVDVTALPHKTIEALPGGGVAIGAAVTNTAVANHRLIRERYPFLAQAILFGASGQIRNMATVAGNLLQRTRCMYFYDGAARCNKRTPGSGCDALEGVALAALDATVRVEGPSGTRAIPFNELHRLPADTPHVETNLAPGELITSVEIPPVGFAARSRYRKVRDRSSYAFALVSVAAAVDIEHGVVTDVRLALGGVAAKPWRALAAERALTGAPATADSFRRAADAELAAARGMTHNSFKIELAKRTIVDVLNDLNDAGAGR
jgi:xanthine dehydrogenase YagS FAD-binding subunit